MIEKTKDLAWKDEIPQQFTSTEMTEIKNAISQETANVKIVPYHVYSPNEQVVGEWQQMVDGVLKKKPIYEKTLFVGDLVAGSYNYTHNISNMDRVVSYIGTAKRSDGAQFNFPSINISSSNYSASVYCVYTESVVVFSVGSSASGTDKFQDCVLVIRYTKTTDEWENV